MSDRTADDLRPEDVRVANVLAEISANINMAAGAMLYMQSETNRYIKAIKRLAEELEEEETR